MKNRGVESYSEKSAHFFLAHNVHLLNETNSIHF